MLKEFCAFGLEHWGSDARGVESTRRFLLEAGCHTCCPRGFRVLGFRV